MIFYAQSLVSLDATKQFASRLAACLKAGDCLALHGGLGVGKTTFVRFLIEALCGPTAVPSPTFTLVQTYETAVTTLWHFDLYRLKQADELYELGWEEALQGIALVEWPERAGSHLPVNRLDVKLDIMTEREGVPTRQISLDGSSAWQLRLKDIMM